MTTIDQARQALAFLEADHGSPFHTAQMILLLRAFIDEAESRAEKDIAPWRKEVKLLTHKVICCGVAASHPDPLLTTHGVYANEWNSQQAEEVRALRRDRDALRASAEKDRADAERYRIWRDDYTEAHSGGPSSLLIDLADAWTPDGVDYAIDKERAARAQGEQQEPKL